MTTNDIEQLERIDLDTKSSQPKQHPWKLARQLEDSKAAEFITREQIYDLTSKFDNPRDKCLFVILYLCAARVGEVVKTQVRTWGKKEVYLKRKDKWKRGYVQDYKKKRVGRLLPSMSFGDISISKFKEKNVLIIRLRNEKNKQKGYGTKLIPIPLKSEIDLKFYEIIRQYVQVFNFDEEELFDIGIRQAERIIKKSGFNPHFIRKLRLTHLVRYYNFTDQKLKAFAGWTDSRPSKHYIRINWEDLIESM